MTHAHKHLLVLAVATNPIVWLAAALAGAVFMTGVAALVLSAMHNYCRQEWAYPCRRHTSTCWPDESEPLSEPAPVVRLDEFGRPEVYTPELAYGGM